MPWAAPKPCAWPGCGRLTRTRHCEQHSAQSQSEAAARDRARGSSAARGYGYKWRQASAAFLKANPLCAEHGRQGLTRASTVTDHIVPHRGDMTLFWDRSNWQALCKACHDAKTAREDGGFGNVANDVRRDRARKGA